MNITKWLTEKLAEETGETSENISITQPFESMNLDSLSILSISHEIETELHIEVDPSAMTEYNNIESLAKWIESNK